MGLKQEIEKGLDVVTNIIERKPELREFNIKTGDLPIYVEMGKRLGKRNLTLEIVAFGGDTFHLEAIPNVWDSGEVRLNDDFVRLKETWSGTRNARTEVRKRKDELFYELTQRKELLSADTVFYTNLVLERRKKGVLELF